MEEEEEYSSYDWFYFEELICNLPLVCNEGDPNIIGLILIMLSYFSFVIFVLLCIGGVFWSIKFIVIGKFEPLIIEMWKQGYSLIKKLFKRE